MRWATKTSVASKAAPLAAEHFMSRPLLRHLQNYFGRKIAVDASMHIYSFLVRSALGVPSVGPLPCCIPWGGGWLAG